MSRRLTNGLLGIIAALLAAHLLILAGVLPLAPLVAPASTYEVVRARLIELVAEDGKVVAQLHTADDGGANLRMRDGRGEVRVKLGATTEGAGLILMNGSTEPAVSLAAFGDEPTVTLARPGAPAQVMRP